jgi:hypothetical protein
MSEGFGLGDGFNDLSGVHALAESKVSDAQRATRRHITGDRWPSAGTVFRALALLVGAVVVGGWLLTAFRS